jgi:hypothetical protein
VPLDNHPVQGNSSVIEYSRQDPGPSVEQLSFSTGLQYPPPLFGLGAHMDSIDQRLFTFCTSFRITVLPSELEHQAETQFQLTPYD